MNEPLRDVRHRMNEGFILSLRAKIAAALASAILVLIVGGISFWAVSRASRAAEAVDRTTAILLEQQRLLAALADAETSTRGYVITGDSSFLSPFKSAQARLPASLARLRGLSADTRRSQKILDTLESVARQRVELSEQVIRFRRDQGFEMARALVATGQGMIVMNHARALAASLGAQERAALAQRIEDQRERQRVAYVVIVAGAALAFLLSLLINRSIRRDVLDRERQQKMIERQAAELQKQAESLEEALHAAETARIAIAESEERKAAVLRSTLDSIVTMNADGVVTEFNPAAEQAFGYTRDEAVGRSLGDLIVPDRYREAHRAGLKRHLETGEEHVLGKRLELPALRRDGSEFMSELTITRSDIGGAPAFTGILRDITIRKEAEAEREKLIKALARSNEELDQFAYVASHDLKAPLRGIANLSQWIEEDLGESLTGQSKDQMEMLRGRVHRMEALIDGILQYSRAGRVRAKPEELDAGLLVREVLELLAPPRSIKVEVAEGLPVIRSEKVPLQQVFLNLVGNAIKHAGGATPCIRIEARDAEPFVEFSVSDNGQGIAPQYHERIFGIFQTLEARDTVEGTGIGLSVVKKIVEAKGGRVWVESDVGKGARFSFLWPRNEITGA